MQGVESFRDNTLEEIIPQEDIQKECLQQEVVL